MMFLYSANVHVFIPMVLLLKIAKNCQKWVYIGMGRVFFLET